VGGGCCRDRDEFPREDAIGYWLLAIGYWLLAIGYWLLAIGYARNSYSTRQKRYQPKNGSSHAGQWVISRSWTSGRLRTHLPARCIGTHKVSLKRRLMGLPVNCAAHRRRLQLISPKDVAATGTLNSGVSLGSALARPLSSNTTCFFRETSGYWTMRPTPGYRLKPEEFRVCWPDSNEP
jgi:hypothetical protein